MFQNLTLTTTRFIYVDITPAMIAIAMHKSKQMGRLNNSILNGKGNFAGFIGEEIVIAALNATSANTYHHDVDFQGVPLEVKTKDRTVPAELDYECSVANYNPAQRAAYYVFASLCRDPNADRDDPTRYKNGYVVGLYPTATYMKRAHYLADGEVSGTNSFSAQASCWNMFHYDLERPW